MLETAASNLFAFGAPFGAPFPVSDVMFRMGLLERQRVDTRRCEAFVSLEVMEATVPPLDHFPDLALSSPPVHQLGCARSTAIPETDLYLFFIYVCTRLRSRYLQWFHHWALLVQGQGWQYAV